jgi:hypothetical protein
MEALNQGKPVNHRHNDSQLGAASIKVIERVLLQEVNASYELLRDIYVGLYWLQFSTNVSDLTREVEPWLF